MKGSLQRTAASPVQSDGEQPLQSRDELPIQYDSARQNCGQSCEHLTFIPELEYIGRDALVGEVRFALARLGFRGLLILLGDFLGRAAQLQLPDGYIPVVLFTLWTANRPPRNSLDPRVPASSAVANHVTWNRHGLGTIIAYFLLDKTSLTIIG
jgi:hypothetical protein